MLFTYFLLILSIHQVNAKLSCKDMQGKDVDWFVAIKLPADVDKEKKGRSFVYFDSRQNGWTLSPKLISDNTSAIGATLSQLYTFDKESTFAIAYNDDSPDTRVDGYRAHSKGVAIFDRKVGFWMVHSVPNFPPTGNYSYPPSGSVYGQSFLCLSLSVNALEDVGEYMRYAHVAPYLTNLPEFHKLAAPSLVDVINKKSLRSSTRIFTTVRGIETLGGKKAKAFSKNKRFGADLWYDFIGLNIDAAMSVETWRAGKVKNNIGSSCADTKRKPNVSNKKSKITKE
ncbi:deoxyribonuclease II [Oesophagostomum dentatum]|uniref:Deoxyribonuclease II n=1 Tax=Oesophagostomum dentatum TaxID=61180 RepID=A0A0B1STG6_OESDE|nr:deoxyribonuclease II [Oesophagostomum dentatum]